MQVLSLKVTQQINGLNNEFKQLIDISQNDFDTLIGTALNRLFEYQTMLSSINAKGRFKCNAPLIVEIEVNGSYISTEDILEQENKDELKIGNTAKGKKRFAQKMYKMLHFAHSTPREIKYTEVQKELDAQIALIDAQKA
jgi:hypothetical protein